MAKGQQRPPALKQTARSPISPRAQGLGAVAYTSFGGADGGSFGGGSNLSGAQFGDAGGYFGGFDSGGGAGGGMGGGSGDAGM